MSEFRDISDDEMMSGKNLFSYEWWFTLWSPVNQCIFSLPVIN